MKNKSRSNQALKAARHMSALKVVGIAFLVSYPLLLVGESVLDSRKGTSGWIYLLAGLISGAIGVAVAELYSSKYSLDATIRTNYEGLSIVGVMLKKAQDATMVSVGLLFAALLVLAVAHRLKGIEVHPPIVLVLLLVALVGILRVQLLKLRIRRGLFGSTETEAREIIRFIMESSNSSDLDDDGKRRPLITDRDIEDIRRRVGRLTAIEARG